MGGARAGPARMGRRRATVLRHNQGADAQGRAADGALAGRPYAVHFRKKDEEQQGGANAAAAGHAAGAPAFESEFDRLARIGN